jgi:hypothetical protein
MAQLQSIDFTQVTAVAITLAAETIAQTSNQTAVESPTCKVAVKFFAIFTPGASTTAVTIRLYRGATAGGTQIGVAVAVAGMFTAGTACQLAACAADQLVNAGQAQYTVTIQQTAGTANGTVNTATLEVDVLSG